MRTLEKTKQAIIEAGFSHIKVELEAQLQRNSDNDESECYECDGRGYQDCSECYGDGALCTTETIGQNEREVWEECADCAGDGTETCSYCDGEGETRGEGSHSDSSCEDYILGQISSEARQALTYGRFYDDGSVDSEYTFTVPVEKAEYIVEYIRAFKDLALNYIGNGFDVSGAGMHVSVIPAESNGSYPSYYRMDAEKMENFKTEVTKLLPALFFVASAGTQSRDLEYRSPCIARDSKYSAIYTHGDTCLEYRLFETCYDRPEAIFEYMEVIAKTLEYMDVTKKVPALNMDFIFEEYGDRLSRFYDTPEQLRVLQRTLKYVKPEGKSMKKMKEERGITHTIGSLSVNAKRRVQRLREDYEQQNRMRERLLRQPLTEGQEKDIEYYMARIGMTRAEAEQRVRGVTERVTFSEFIRQNTRPMGQTVRV